MATKKVAQAAQFNGAAVSAVPSRMGKTMIPSPSNPLLQGSITPVPPHLQPKPAAKPLDQVKKAVKPSPRKETLASVKATSSKAQTEKTIPYVLLRRATKPGAKATRSIVNFIVVADTVDASHVRPVRVAIVDGDAYGTNFDLNVHDIRKARFFDYSRGIRHGKSAKTVMPWDVGNDQAIRALQKLGAISKYDLEFHLTEAKRRKQYQDELAAANAAKQQSKIALKRLTSDLKALIKQQGIVNVRAAVRAANVALTQS